VSEGLALAYRRYSTDYVGQEQAAREAKRGLWLGEFVKPWQVAQRETNGRREGRGRSAWDMPHQVEYQPEWQTDLPSTKRPVLCGDQDQ